MVRVVIHSNPSLANQIESAEWLRQGFEKHGIRADVTADVYRKGDVHVVQGPHYAYRHWVGKPNVLFLNRCFYGDERFDLSIGWLKPDGTRDFCVWDADEPNGELPELKPMKERTGKQACAVVFGDYGKDPTHMVREARSTYGRVYYRPHPADLSRQSPTLSLEWSLEEIWEMADVAVGRNSTVLVEAVINGLRVDCSPDHVCAGIDDREQWLTDLSWAQWHFDQIIAGEFWEHLCT